MARTRPRIAVGWYLPEWMDTLHVSQADMTRLAGWSKTTASLLYNCQQDYNPELVRAAAHALNVRTYELFMPPEEAMALRRLRQSAVTIAGEDHVLRAAEDRKEWRGKPPRHEDDDDHTGKDGPPRLRAAR